MSDSTNLPPEQSKPDQLSEANRRANVEVEVIHSAILREGTTELYRPTAALAFSGVAAGLSMSASFFVEAQLRALLPDVPWRTGVASIGYSIGFLLVILGRQQLFTENTLTVILPLMREKSGRALANVLRVWAVVLATNLVAGVAVAYVLHATPAVGEGARQAMAEMGGKVAGHSFTTTLVRGIFAGWLIALLVWVLPAAERSRVAIIVVVTYVVAVMHFAHVIVGTIETSYAAFAGTTTWWRAMGVHLQASLIGNVIGGVSLTAAVNHAQVVAGED